MDNGEHSVCQRAIFPLWEGLIGKPELYITTVLMIFKIGRRR